MKGEFCAKRAGHTSKNQPYIGRKDDLAQRGLKEQKNMTTIKESWKKVGKDLGNIGDNLLGAAGVQQIVSPEDKE